MLFIEKHTSKLKEKYKLCIPSKIQEILEIGSF
jgi:hypothetical protein